MFSSFGRSWFRWSCELKQNENVAGAIVREYLGGAYDSAENSAARIGHVAMHRMIARANPEVPNNLPPDPRSAVTPPFRIAIATPRLIESAASFQPKLHLQRNELHITFACAFEALVQRCRPRKPA